MGIVSGELKKIVESMISTIEAARDPMQTRGTVKVDVKLVGQQSSESKIRNFTLKSDEPLTSGGTDTGPNPLEFFVASVGFCENVTFARHAALMDLNLKSLETTIRGHWERKGQFEIDGADPSFRDMTVETKVVSDDPVEKIVEITRLAHKRCPMHATISKAMKITDKLFVNGEEVPI